MRGTFIDPVITETRFNCPHCGTLAAQKWMTIYARKHTDSEGNRIPPYLSTEANLIAIKTDDDLPDEAKNAWASAVEKELTGKIYVIYNDRENGESVPNLNIAVCEQCDEASIWIRDRLLYPPSYVCSPAHEDMPATIQSDYNEARSIIDLSPRASAALSRLCIEKLCIHLLGKDVGSIDKAIGILVAEHDLDKRLQKKFDIVRVNGNALVHGGTMEEGDDRRKAAYLLDLVNQIVDEAITRPKRLDAEYFSLPEDKLKGIADREKRIAGKKTA